MGGGGGRQGHWLQRLNKVRCRGLSFSLQASTRPRTGTPVKESSHGCGRCAPEFLVVCELCLWEHCKSASSPIFSCIKLESNDAYSSIPPPRSRSRGIVLSRGECRKKPANGRRSRAGAAFSCFRKHDGAAGRRRRLLEKSPEASPRQTLGLSTTAAGSHTTRHPRRARALVRGCGDPKVAAEWVRCL